MYLVGADSTIKMGINVPWLVLAFLYSTTFKCMRTSEAEDFNPLDHILSASGPGIHFNDEVSVDEGNPSLHLDELSSDQKKLIGK